MEQPWNQNQQREAGGFGVAMGESSCHAAADLGQAGAGLCEVDGALLLMELMQDHPPSSDLLLLDGDGDRRLSHVIRSLEAEIGGGEAGAMVADDDGGESMDRIEDALSSDGTDGYDYEGACASSSSFGYWPPSSLLLAGGYDEAEGWCVYAAGGGGGNVVGYDDYCCCAEGSAENMYLPLWE
jgi:hypothetical protein